MKKIFSVLFIAIVSSMLLIPALFTNFKTDCISEIDNRKLAEFPKLNEVDNINKYFDDRVGFRTQIINLYSKINNSMDSKELANPLYEYGKDGWIMTKNWDTCQTFHLDIDENYIKQFASFISEANDISKENGASFMFWLIPNKETVYPEYMSDKYSIDTNRITKAEKIVSELTNNNIPNLYLLPDFLKLKSEIQLYNKKSDPGHWNQTGAFYGIQILNNYLRENFSVNIDSLKSEDFNITSKTEQYLYNTYIEINEEVPVYTLKKQEYTEDDKTFWSNINVDDNSYHMHIVTNDKSLESSPKILIFGDSYLGNDTFKFFANQYKEIFLIHSKNIQNFQYYIETFKPDVVIIEAVERMITPSDGAFSNESVNCSLKK